MNAGQSRFTRLLVPVTLGVTLSACTTWTTQSEAPAVVINQQQPRRLRVHVADPPRMIWMEAPISVHADTLSGWDQLRSGVASVPIDNVAYVDVQSISAPKTVALVLGISAALIVAGYAALAAVATPSVTRRIAVVRSDSTTYPLARRESGCRGYLTAVEHQLPTPTETPPGPGTPSPCGCGRSSPSARSGRR